MKIENDIKLDFSDVLIKPKRSHAVSRADVDLNRQFKFLNCQQYDDNLTDFGVPIIAANMDTIGTMEMARALAKHGCSTALHKFYSLAELEKFFGQEEQSIIDKVFYTTGTGSADFEKLRMLFKLAVPVQKICIDVANGYTQTFVDKCREVREWFPNSIIMAGNVCTPEQTLELLLVGKVDVVKIGVGGGKSCKTRLVAGVGVPQLSAIIECADAAHGVGGHICSDGGIRMPGDVAKAIGAGADFVMIGGYFAGHDECGGKFIYDENGNRQKMIFYGMSSEEAMKKHYGGKASYRASEGRVLEVPYKGNISETIEELLGGLRSACTYVGTRKLKDLSKCTTFVRVNRIHDNLNP
jgi:GMP reductase